MSEPTHDELLDEDGLKRVQRETDDGWRHGCYVSEVFHRAVDDTYWLATYSLSTDGETHGLRDNQFSVTQVWPHEKTVIDYKTTP